jgi:hypothetical protein
MSFIDDEPFDIVGTLIGNDVLPECAAFAVGEAALPRLVHTSLVDIPLVSAFYQTVRHDPGKSFVGTAVAFRRKPPGGFDSFGPSGYDGRR